MTPDNLLVQRLIADLEKGNIKTRAAAATALGRIGNTLALQPLVAALSFDDLTVRIEIVEALGMIGDVSAVQPLLKLLSQQGNSTILDQTIGMVLSKFGLAAVPPLITALRDQSSTILVRAWSARALGTIGDQRSLEPLIWAIKDSNAHVRGAVTEALGHFADEAATETLIQSLNDEDAVVRSEAAYALGQVGEERAIAALYVVQQHDVDQDVRATAMSAIRQIARRR